MWLPREMGDVGEKDWVFGINRCKLLYREWVNNVILYRSESERLLVMYYCGTPWTVARQALLSMGFPRPEYWSGLPFPSPGDLSDARIK